MPVFADVRHLLWVSGIAGADFPAGPSQSNVKLDRWISGAADWQFTTADAGIKLKRSNPFL
jgi:hypothetical protein